MINLAFKVTREPDFSGFMFYVKEGHLFHADDYADAYGVNVNDIDVQDIHSVQDAAGRLNPGEWLHVEHSGRGTVVSRDTNIRRARKAAKAILGADNARVTHNGEVHVRGTAPVTGRPGWYLLGYAGTCEMDEMLWWPDGSLNKGLTPGF